MLSRIARPLSTAARSTGNGARFMSSATAQPKQRSNFASKAAMAAVAGGAVIGSGIALHAKEESVNIDEVKADIVDIFEKDNKWGPTFVRLAWHASGTYSKAEANGGSSGGTIRFSPEINHGANAGLIKAVKVLESVKEKHPSITYADLYVLSGVAAIEEMGGPSVPFRLGRKDAESEKECTPDGRLPDADKGSKSMTIQHVRDIFYRMGFDDREIVALLGAHAVGRCYKDRSGYVGPWTRAEWTFSNEYFRELLENEWKVKKIYAGGPDQYSDPTGDLMMLHADMALLWDPEFRKYVEMYAKDEDLWHSDFSKAFQKLTENGVDFGDKSWFAKLWPF